MKMNYHHHIENLATAPYREYLLKQSCFREYSCEEIKMSKGSIYGEISTILNNGKNYLDFVSCQYL